MTCSACTTRRSRFWHDPGMKIMAPVLLDALAKCGAQVDAATQVVRFPRWLVEGTIAGMQADLRGGRKPILLNGVVSSKSSGPVQAKFGGACIEVFDWEKQTLRPPTRQDLIDLVRLGEALPEVATVGNPVVYLTEDDGAPVDPRMQRIKTAALIACHTTKAGATEVWNAWELDYLMEIGEIVRGSRAAYLANPCFVTAKETISPLTLDDKAGEVLVLLAQRGLPTTIIPMPLTGGSAPMALAANVALCNAEVLGVATAVRCAVPDAWVAGGVISGVLDMSSGSASFAAPEAVLQDLGIAELHERLYGFDFAIGTGYTDAKYPGPQSVMEKLAKYWAAYRSGRVNYPVGLVNGGKAFSPEQALARPGGRRLDSPVRQGHSRQRRDAAPRPDPATGHRRRSPQRGTHLASHAPGRLVSPADGSHPLRRAGEGPRPRHDRARRRPQAKGHGESRLRDRRRPPPRDRRTGAPRRAARAGVNGHHYVKLARPTLKRSGYTWKAGQPA